MADRALPNVGLKGFWALGEDNWKDDNDLNLLKLSVLVQAGVMDFGPAEPGTPADGDVFLLDETHATHPNAIAIRDAGAWVYVTPLEGWWVYDRTAEFYRSFNGTAWIEFVSGSGGGGVGGDNALYRFGGFFTTTPGAGEVVMRHVVTDAITLPADLDGSRVEVGTDPSATTVLSVQKNGVEFATISISTGGVVTLDGDETDFVPGDLVSVVAPADSHGAADVTFTFRAGTAMGFLPVGGTDGQVLAKASDDDYDVEWVDQTGGGGGGGGGEAPVLVQVSTAGRTTPGTTDFPATCTAGNTIILVYSGFALQATPAGYGLIYSFSQSNQSLQIWAKISDGTEDTIAFMSASGNDGQCIGYEFEGAVSVLPPTFGYWNAANYSPIILPPFVKHAMILLAAEGDNAYTWSTATVGVTVDYATPGGATGNHYGIFAHVDPDFVGSVTLTSAGSDNKVVGFFAVGKV